MLELILAVLLVVLGAGYWMWSNRGRARIGTCGLGESSLPGKGRRGGGWGKAVDLNWLTRLALTAALITLLRAVCLHHPHTRPTLGRDIRLIGQPKPAGWSPSPHPQCAHHSRTTDGWVAPFQPGASAIGAGQRSVNHHLWLQRQQNASSAIMFPALQWLQGRALATVGTVRRGALLVLLAEPARLRRAFSSQPWRAPATGAVVGRLGESGFGKLGGYCRLTVEIGCKAVITSTYTMYQLLVSAVRLLTVLTVGVVSTVAMETGTWELLTAVALSSALTAVPWARACQRAVAAVGTSPVEEAGLAAAAAATVIVIGAMPRTYHIAAMLLWLPVVIEMVWEAMAARAHARPAVNSATGIPTEISQPIESAPEAGGDPFSPAETYVIGRWKRHTRWVRVPRVSPELRAVQRAARCKKTRKAALDTVDVACAIFFRRHAIKNTVRLLFSTVMLLLVLALFSASFSMGTRFADSWAALRFVFTAMATRALRALYAAAEFCSAVAAWATAIPAALAGSKEHATDIAGMLPSSPTVITAGSWDQVNLRQQELQFFSPYSHARQFGQLLAGVVYIGLVTCIFAQWAQQAAFSISLIQWDRGWKDPVEATKRFAARLRSRAHFRAPSARRRRRETARYLCFMAKDSTSTSKFEGMGALQGMALHFKLDEFIDDCLEQDGHKPMDEEFYIRRLMTICGKNSPVGLAATTVVTNDELRNESPKEHALQLAKENRLKHAHRVEMDGIHSSPVTAALKLMVDNAYPEYRPDPQDLQDVQFWRMQALNLRDEYQEVLGAQQMLAQLEGRLQQQRLEHESRNLWSRWSWLQAQPEYAGTVAHIDRHIKTVRDTMGESERKHAHYVDRQFHEAEDFGALLWLRDYVVKSVGAITSLHVDVWRETRMMHGQTPAQAFANFLKEAQVFVSVRIPGFHLPTELLKAITTKDLPNGPFFPPALYDEIESRVRTYLDMTEHIGSDAMKIVQAWVDTAQRTHYDSAQYNRSLHDRILSQLAARGSLKSWAQRIQDMLARVRKLSKWENRDTKETAGEAPATETKQKEKGQLWCDNHGQCGHTTEQCRNKKKKAPGGKDSNANVVAAIEELLKVMTTTLGPGQSPLQAGMRPGARYGQGVETQPAAADTPATNQQGAPLCQVCTKVAGAPHYHKGECFCKDTPAPDWFRPRNRKIWDAVNKIRAKHGKAALPEPAPASAPRKAAMATVVKDPGAGGASTSAADMVAMMNLGQQSRSEDLAENRLHFEEFSNPPAFFCKPCGQRACEVVRKQNGELYKVSCTGCRTEFHAVDLPPTWAHQRIWVHPNASPIPPTPAPSAGFGSYFASGTVAGQSPAAQPLLPLRGLPPKPPGAAPVTAATSSSITYLGIQLDAEPALAECCQSIINRRLEPVFAVSSLVRFLRTYPMTNLVAQVLQALLKTVPVEQQPQVQSMWNKLARPAGAGEAGNLPTTSMPGSSAGPTAGGAAGTALPAEPSAAATSNFPTVFPAASAAATFFTGAAARQQPAAAQSFPLQQPHSFAAAATQHGSAGAATPMAAPTFMPALHTAEAQGLLSQTATLLEQFQQQAAQPAAQAQRQSAPTAAQGEALEEFRTQLSEFEGKLNGVLASVAALNDLVTALTRQREQQLEADVSPQVAQMREQLQELRTTCVALDKASSAQAATSLQLAQSLKTAYATYASTGAFNSLEQLVGESSSRVNEIGSRASLALATAQGLHTQLATLPTPLQHAADRDAVANLRAEVTALRAELAQGRTAAAEDRAIVSTLRAELTKLQQSHAQLEKATNERCESLNRMVEEWIADPSSGWPPQWVSRTARGGATISLRELGANLPPLNVRGSTSALADEPPEGARKSAKRSLSGTPRATTPTQGERSEAAAAATEAAAEIATAGQPPVLPQESGDAQPTPERTQELLSQAAAQLRAAQEATPAIGGRLPGESLAEFEGRVMLQCGLFSGLTEQSLLSSPRPSARAGPSSSVADPPAVARNLTQELSAADEAVPPPVLSYIPAGAAPQPRRSPRSAVTRYPSMNEDAMGPAISSDSNDEEMNSAGSNSQHQVLMMREGQCREKLLLAALAEFDEAAEWQDCQEESEVEPAASEPADAAATILAAAEYDTQKSEQTICSSKAVQFSNVDEEILPTTDSWPSIHPALRPFIPVTTRARYKRGAYKAGKGEQQLWHHYFGRKATVVTLQQQHPATSLRLFSIDDQRVLLPDSVLVDSGASILMLISPGIAEELGLKYEPNSATLVGVGGQGGALGRSKRKIRVCLGGSEHAGDKSVSALQGCFTLWVNPIIMTNDLVARMGYTVVLGATYLRLCAASFVHLEEELEISPALLQHQCPGLRVRLPCTMSVESQNLPPLVAEAGQDWALRPEDAKAKSGRTKRQRTRQRGTEPPQQAMMMSEQPTASMTNEEFDQLMEECAAMQCTQPGLDLRAGFHQSPDGGVCHEGSVMLLHPGMPQSEQPPTREQYAAHRARAALSTAARAEERAAHALGARPENPAELQPTSVAYRLEDLRRSGRLREGFVLDLATPDLGLATLCRQMKQQLLEQLRRELSITPQTEAAKAPAAPTSASAPPKVGPAAVVEVPARSAPLETIVPGPRGGPSTILELPEDPFCQNAVEGATAAGPQSAALSSDKTQAAPTQPAREAAPSTHAMRTRKHAKPLFEPQAAGPGGEEHPVVLMTKPRDGSSPDSVNFVKAHGWRPAVRALSLLSALQYWNNRLTREEGRLSRA